MPQPVGRKTADVLAILSLAMHRILPAPMDATSKPAARRRMLAAARAARAPHGPTTAANARRSEHGRAIAVAPTLLIRVEGPAGFMAVDEIGLATAAVDVFPRFREIQKPARRRITR